MDRTLLDHLRDDAEVEISTTTAGGDTRSTTIWAVAVDAVPYVRSVKGTRGVWWRRATARDGNGFVVDGTLHRIRLEPVEDESELAAVDAALEAKYRSRWSSSTDAMLTPEARPRTLRVVDA